MAKNHRLQQQSIRMLVFLAALAAISLVLSRFLVIYITPSVRINFGNIPIILAGLWFGPVAGALTGAVADIMGSVVLSGMGWFPPLTLSALLMGLLPGLLKKTLLKKQGFWRVFACVGITNLIASVGWSTYCLSALYGLDFMGLLAVRAPLYTGMSALEAAAVYALCKNLGFNLEKLMRRELKGGVA